MGKAKQTIVTARDAGLKRCGSCGQLQKIEDQRACPRCGAWVSERRSNSLQRTCAFMLVAVVAYIPANVMPIMITKSFMGTTADTIMSGVFSLVDSGSVGVAAIVFIASICIPVLKFITIAMLALSLRFSVNFSEHKRHRLHTLIEFIGRWSMIDVFVVAVLAALIQLGAILSIAPGFGINAFALSVVFSMFAASSLDSRLLWETQTDTDQYHNHDHSTL